MSKTKICFVINSIKNCGPGNILMSMLKSIDKKLYDVSLVTLLDENDKEYTNRVKNEQVSIIELNYKKSIRTLLKSKEISSIINKGNYDLIHVHGHITALIVKYVKTKKIITVHNRLYEDFKGMYGPLLGKLVNYLYIKEMKKYDKIVCCSKASYRKCKKHFKNISYINNGMYFNNLDSSLISLKKKKIREELGLSENAKIFIYVGNYNKAKNVIKLIETFKKFKKENEYLLMLGSGPLYEDCQKYNDNNIIQLGFKNNATEYMSASDYYISFSLTEGFPASIIEALNNNLLLLLSNIEAHNDIISIDDNYYIGEIFDLDDNNSFALKKEILTSSERNDSKRFQHDYLSSETMMEKYQIEYEQLIKRGDN